MLDINYIRNNIDKVKKAVIDKQLVGTVDIDRVVEIHDSYLEALKKVESHRSLKNKLSEDISKVDSETRTKLLQEAKTVKDELTSLEENLAVHKKELDDILLWVPNVPADDVPIGPDESGNVEVKKVGLPAQFSFTPKDHLDLGLALGIIDVDRGVKIAGFRGYFLKNEGADLEAALIKYALEHMKKQGFDYLTVPWMVKPEYFTGTGYFPWGEEDHYRTQDGKALIGTAEVSLTSYHANEILDEADLPIKLVGVSPCFRREVGSHGKDTKGIFRIHQFTKVEQVVLVENNEDSSREWHNKMLGYSEDIIRGLGMSYRVLLMCSGDMGPGQRRKYDIETWFPSQNKYRETHSDSYFNDFQSRRLNIRYRTKTGELKFVHTLNNTVAATPRLLCAVLENYQQADGSVVVPEVLRPYTNFEVIKPK
jgi:seryl-tRNA synthetase